MTKIYCSACSCYLGEGTVYNNPIYCKACYEKHGDEEYNAGVDMGWNSL